MRYACCYWSSFRPCCNGEPLPVKILLVSFHFPPDAPLAATRAPKFAKHLIAAGHDVRVLCAQDPQTMVTHELEIDPKLVIRTPWRDLRQIPGQALARFRRSGGDGGAAGKPTSNVTSTSEAITRKSLRNRLSGFYDAAVCRPDGRIGWQGEAIGAARALFEKWRPDVVYATCPPHSTAVIAARIARLADAPLVAEFRDRWAHDAYSDHPGWRRGLDHRQEAAVLNGAAGIVTVSPFWAEGYRQRYGAERVVVAMNGFDPADYSLDRSEAPSADSGTLDLLYAGALYPGRRDPGPIFEAIALLGVRAANIRVTMLGKDLEMARKRALASGVGDCLNILPAEPHSKIIARQYASDALLMLQWNDARDAGTIPGKLFECIGSRRPVIATGWEEGAVAGIIRERNLGLISNDPARIALMLGELLDQKRSVGRIAPLPADIRDGYSRAEQFRLIEPLLDRAAGQGASALAAE